MLKGRFVEKWGRVSPFLTCEFEFPHAPHLGASSVDLLVDTGAERTTLSRTAAENAGLNLAALPDGGTSTGVGGVTAMRVVESRLSVQGYSTFLRQLRISESRHSVPSILGRDFIREFALFMEESTDRVLFLAAADVEMYGLAGLGRAGA